RKGDFAGIVVSSVSMDFFRRMFESVEAKSGAAIALVSTRGTVLARSRPGFGEAEYEAMAMDPDALEYTSANDQVTRVGSSARLAQYPMLVVVSQDSDEVLASWRNQVRNHLLVAVALLAGIAFLGYRVDQAGRATQIQALRDTLTGLANRRCLN